MTRQELLEKLKGAGATTAKQMCEVLEDGAALEVLGITDQAAVSVPLKFVKDYSLINALKENGELKEKIKQLEKKNLLLQKNWTPSQVIEVIKDWAERCSFLNDERYLGAHDTITFLEDRFGKESPDDDYYLDLKLDK